LKSPRGPSPAPSTEPAPLSLPHAFSTPDNKRRYVRRLFATIADRYDFITVLFSGGQDRRWKRRLIRLARIEPGERVLDLATGTGDIAYLARASGVTVVALDITLRMVQLAAAKRGDAREPRFLVGDMMALPFADASFDVVTTGYGLRNVPDLTDAISEVARVLGPGGRFVSLDFNRPQNGLVCSLYLFYLSMVGGAVGWLLHGDADTYRYIPASIRHYPGAAGVTRLLREQGFERARYYRILGGLMAIHQAEQ
jgi:demethylmenaquinone methyltransferase/2-methoxy-6-polyprenyl-1,4-benzoquinol methylase